MNPNDLLKASKGFARWKNPLKWLLLPGAFIVLGVIWGVHEQKNIREARRAMLSAGLPSEPEARAATADDVEAPPANPGGVTLYHLNAIMVSDAGPAVLGPNVHVVESHVSSANDLIQNGHVQNYNAYVESAGRVIQNGDVQNVGGIVRSGAALHDGG